MTKENPGWPAYLLNGRVRTSTVTLIVAFLLVWWIYEINQPESPSPSQQAPETVVVPPGFKPDPNYTWVPRTNVREPTETTTPTPATTTAETPSPTSPTDTPTSGPPTTTPAAPGAGAPSPSSVMPGPGPSPTPSQ